MRAFLILCDFAEAINGKLYIQGGGWTRLAATGAPTSLFVAGKVLVPWTDANRRLGFLLTLVTADGAIVRAPNHEAVQVNGDVELGRPAGLPEGSDLDFPLSFRFDGLALPVGRYRWELSVDGAAIADVTFDVVAP